MELYLVTKTESILDFYKEKPKGLFDFLSEVFSSSGATSFIYNSCLLYTSDAADE